MELEHSRLQQETLVLPRVTPLAPCSWPPGTLLWTGLDRGCVLQPQKHIQAGTMAS